mgnify:CR=1 FL=1
MKILGIHDGHNASACLIEDGELRFAIQEERLVYEKNKSGFPKKSIELLMKQLRLKPEEIDLIAFASRHVSPLFGTALGRQYKRMFGIRRRVESIIMKTPLYNLYKAMSRVQRKRNIRRLGFRNKVKFFDHHLCHAATAYYGSHFPRNEKVLVLTNDGAGDGLCATVSIGENGKLQRLAKVKSDHSLAGVYSLTTKLLGFQPLEHEYKLMGMAPYASERGHKIGYEAFKKYVSLSEKDPLKFKKSRRGAIKTILPQLEKDTRYMRFDWICAGLQRFTEEVLVGWVDNCLKATATEKLALAGGIFMNVKANKKIMELKQVKDMFIFPSCGDETVSMGAAYAAYAEFRKATDPDIQPLKDFYLGDDFSNEKVLKEIDKLKTKNLKWKKIKNIEKELAQLLVDGQVVARCKGRMEFGARALGNRSILADPSNLRCLREINLMVKKRDFWMPFAPVMLKERADEYIINKKSIAAPYMILSFDTTEKYDDLIAAVHQADLTARPQIIDKTMNPDYYSILKEFEKLTGCGALLNTSFNLHGFPIVHGPKEALDVFIRSGLRYLAVGNYLIEKKQQMEP